MVFLVAFNELTVSALLWSSGTETLGVVLKAREDIEAMKGERLQGILARATSATRKLAVR